MLIALAGKPQRIVDEADGGYFAGLPAERSRVKTLNTVVGTLQGDITQPKMLGWGVADFLRDYANLFRASALENLALAPSGMQKAYKIKSEVQSSNPKHK